MRAEPKASRRAAASFCLVLTPGPLLFAQPFAALPGHD
jgi:hypothetical protein